MLKPASDRLDYGNLLIPPPDYKVDFALGTTYSLNLEALVGITVALFLSEEMNNNMLQNPVVALEGLRRSSEHFAVLCEAGQITVPPKHNTVFSLLDNSVFTVSLANSYAFHPKTWLVRYKNKENQPLYRVIVLSRNLTFDRSWDMAVCLEGGLKKKKSQENVPLIDFIKYLRRRVKNPKKSNKITVMMDELQRIKFEPINKHFKGFAFHPMGIEGYSRPEALFDTYRDLLIISPFISKSVLDELDNKSLTNPSKTIITRREEIPKLSAGLLKSFNVYAMKEMVVDGEEGVSGDEIDEVLHQSQDIHAKFYARTKYRHDFFIGSANCTNSAFHGNVEFLLQLNYDKWGFGLAALLADLFGEDEKENPFEKIDVLPEIEKTDTTIADELEKGIKDLCRSKPKATVKQDGERYQLLLEFSSIPDDIKFTISTLGSSQQVNLKPKTTINNLPLEHLGEFYRITAYKDDVRIQRIIKIQTIGIPADRDKAIFKTIIKDSKTFMSYMAFLLSDSLLISSLEQFDAERISGTKWDINWLQSPAFYENLLKTVSREPERLSEIDRVIQLIDDPEIIPEKFMELYRIFAKAAKKVK